MPKGYTNRTLREIVRIVASRFTRMLVIFVIVFASVVIATFLAPRWYRSEARILVRPAQVKDPSDTSGSLRDRVSLFIITQREIILSDHVLGSALMRLEGRPPQPGSLHGPTSPYLPWYRQEEIETYIRGNMEELRKVRKWIKVRTPGGPEDAFSPGLTITVDYREQRKRALTSSAESRKLAAGKAHDLANFLVEAYRKRRTQQESERTKARADFLLEECFRKADTELQRARKELQNFNKTTAKGDLLLLAAMRAGGSGIESGTAALTTEFQAEINRIDAELADLKTLKQTVDSELSKTDLGDIVVPDAVTAVNPLLTKLQEKILQLKLQINSLTPRYTDEYRELKDTTAELAAAQKDLHSEMVKQSRRLQQQIESLTARRETHLATVTADRKRVDLLAAKAARYEELHSKVDNAEAIHMEAKKQYENALAARKLAERKDTFLVTVLDKPSVPDADRPRRPILWLNIVIAVAAGLVLAVLYAFLADHFDHTIKSIDDAERYLQTPVLGSVPKLGRNIIRTT